MKGDEKDDRKNKNRQKNNKQETKNVFIHIALLFLAGEKKRIFGMCERNGYGQKRIYS